MVGELVCDAKPTDQTRERRTAKIQDLKLTRRNSLFCLLLSQFPPIGEKLCVSPKIFVA